MRKGETMEYVAGICQWGNCWQWGIKGIEQERGYSGKTVGCMNLRL